ncbi:MAG: PD40 domain-containing protein [Acidobacteria bacterium]|nr:PD40 domain-containing protein [Acidobacteriota bacterium]
MNRRACALLILVASALLWSDLGAQTKQEDIPRLPGAQLLVGWPGYKLLLTTPKETRTLQEKEHGSTPIPSMSRDGTLIASGRVVKCCEPRVLILQTYSVEQKKWTDYKKIERGGGAVYISPDGSKLALARDERGEDFPVRVYFIDLKTGIESASPVIGSDNPRAVSWSPDGSRIAYYMFPSKLSGRPSIHILDIRSGKITNIVDGEGPAWSPSGEWIAYFDVSRYQVWLVHPDGTGSKLLLTLGKRWLFLGLRSMQRGFGLAPVWSPDSKTLLLNEIASGEMSTYDIHLLDLSTLKMTRKFKNTMPVYAWADAK